MIYDESRLEDLNHQNEAAVLGSILRDRSMLDVVYKILPDEFYFSKPEYRTLYKCLLKIDPNNVWTFETIGLAIKEQGFLVVIGGPEGLQGIWESVCTACNAAFHAEKVKENYIARELSGLSDTVKKTMAQPGTVKEKLYSIERVFSELRDEVKPLPEKDCLEARMEETIAGKRRPLFTPWPLLDNSSLALVPETLTLLCGTPGASKSFMLLQLLAHFLGDDIPSVVLELEEKRSYHSMRALAQLTGVADLTRNDWVETHPEESRAALREYKGFIDKIEAAIDVTDSQWTFPQITNWIHKKACAGFRFIAVDPVTVAQNTKRDVWVEHNEFCHQVQQIAKEYCCTLLFVTHPVKAFSCPDLNQLAGSAAFGRQCQSAFWLEYLKEPVRGDIRTQMGTIPQEYNRVIHILKARGSMGQGLRLAYNFNAGLSLHELGVLVKKPKKNNENF